MGRSLRGVVGLAVPVILASLLFAGGLITLVGTWGYDQISWFIPAQWGFAASAATVDLRRVDALAANVADVDPLRGLVDVRHGDARPARRGVGWNRPLPASASQDPCHQRAQQVSGGDRDGTEQQLPARRQPHRFTGVPGGQATCDQQADATACQTDRQVTRIREGKGSAELPHRERTSQRTRRRPGRPRAFRWDPRRSRWTRWKPTAWFSSRWISSVAVARFSRSCPCRRAC